MKTMKLRSLSRLLLTATLAGCGLGGAAHATEDDFNVWTGQFVTTDVDKQGRWFVRGEAQERFTEDADRLGQLLLRSFVGYRVNSRTSLGGGYAYVLTNPSGPAKTNEHRLYQEINLRLVETGAGLTLDTRTRLEQRVFEEGGDAGWRYRLFVQVRAPISKANRLVAYSEPFIGLNRTRFNRRGLAVWRNFAGVSVPLGKGIEMVPGYLNQYVVRDGIDRIDHTGNVNLFVAF